MKTYKAYMKTRAYKALAKVEEYVAGYVQVLGRKRPLEAGKERILTMPEYREIKDLTFQELVDKCSVDIHSGLLEGGGKGLKSSVWLALNMAVQWRMAQEELAKKQQK
jgi:hypothetical protein